MDGRESIKETGIKNSASGIIGEPQFWQYFFLLVRTPQAGQTTVLLSTSFPQFLQYISTSCFLFQQENVFTDKSYCDNNEDPVKFFVFTRK